MILCLTSLIMRILASCIGDRMESKFGKSLLNKGTENSGLACSSPIGASRVLTCSPNGESSNSIDIPGAFGTQTFDAVVTDSPVEPLHPGNVEKHFASLRLVEMKTTRKPIRNEALSGFFFGATRTRV